MINYKEGYIICENNLKMSILKELSTQNQFKDYTFLSLNNLKQMLTFSVKKRAVIEVMLKYGISPLVAKEYINSLLSLNGVYDTPKGIFLKEILDFLFSIGLATTDELFKNRARSSHFTFVGYDMTKELEYVISLLNKEHIDIICDPKTINVKQLCVYNCSTIEDECSFVFNHIYQDLKNGFNINDIKICNVNKDYNFLLNRFSNTYKIPLTQNYGNDVSATNEGLLLLKLIDDGKSIDEIEHILKKSFKDMSIVNKIIDEINNYEAYMYDPKLIKSIFVMILKNISFNTKHFENEVEIIDIHDITKYSDKRIYLMHFDISVPMVKKDEDFILDSEKRILNIDTSLEINILNKNRFINDLYNCEDIVISFANQNSFKNEIISPLVMELGFIEKKISKLDYQFGINEITDNLYLAKALDNYSKFNEENDVLSSHYYDSISYKTYDNKFKGLNLEEYNLNKKDVFVLSYSDMSKFLMCPFSYYLSKILKIEVFSSTIDTRLGTFAHGILEDFELKGDDFDIDEAVKYYLEEDERRNAPRSKRENFYFEQMKENTLRVIERIKMHKNHTRLSKVYCEKKMDVYLDNGKLCFKGFIDKIWYSENESYVAIIDYKTGKEKCNLDNVEDGLNLQLPVYIYLLKNNDKFKDSSLCGIYLQKINIILPLHKAGSFEEQFNKNVNLEGYTNPDYVSYIDDTNGDYLKNFKMNKSGKSIDSRSLLIDDNDIQKLYDIVASKIDYVYKEIMNARFTIKDLKVDGKTVSCQYCEYCDVCFKTIKDSVYLQKKPFGEDGDKNANE